MRSSYPLALPSRVSHRQNVRAEILLRELLAGILYDILGQLRVIRGGDLRGDADLHAGEGILGAGVQHLRLHLGGIGGPGGNVGSEDLGDAKN